MVKIAQEVLKARRIPHRLSRRAVIKRETTSTALFGILGAFARRATNRRRHFNAPFHSFERALRLYDRYFERPEVVKSPLTWSTQ